MVIQQRRNFTVIKRHRAHRLGLHESDGRSRCVVHSQRPHETDGKTDP